MNPAPLRAMVILTENHTLVPPGDLQGLIDMAVSAERSGIDAVMLSDHVCLGPEAGAMGRPANPREYAAPGNQDPATEWPSPIVMAAAIASATSSIRIALAALITPLRNPVVLAKDLATLDRVSDGRIVVQPTVSWSKDEYEAVGVPFDSRGRILDDGLDAMCALWASTPATHHGPYFSFENTYCEPSPLSPTGPTLWFGGQHMHPALVRRLVSRGSGFHPFGAPTPQDMSTLAHALSAAGRSLADLEVIGGTRAQFPNPNDTADLMESMADFPDQIAQGVTTFAMKPSQHTNDPEDVEALCARMTDHLSWLERSR